MQSKHILALIAATSLGTTVLPLCANANNNRLYLEQVGAANAATINQNGNNNYIGALQNGNQNQFNITQSGNDGYVNANSSYGGMGSGGQHGNNNAAALTQNGNESFEYLLRQSGNGNSFSKNTAGNRHHGLQVQEGDGNVINVAASVNNATHSSQQAYQRGNGNQQGITIAAEQYNVFMSQVNQGLVAANNATVNVTGTALHFEGGQNSVGAYDGAVQGNVLNATLQGTSSSMRAKQRGDFNDATLVSNGDSLQTTTDQVNHDNRLNGTLSGAAGSAYAVQNSVGSPAGEGNTLSYLSSGNRTGVEAFQVGANIGGIDMIGDDNRTRLYQQNVAGEANANQAYVKVRGHRTYAFVEQDRDPGTGLSINPSDANVKAGPGLAAGSVSRNYASFDVTNNNSGVEDNNVGINARQMGDDNISIGTIVNNANVGRKSYFSEQKGNNNSAVVSMTGSNISSAIWQDSTTAGHLGAGNTFTSTINGDGAASNATQSTAGTQIGTGNNVSAVNTGFHNAIAFSQSNDGISGNGNTMTYAVTGSNFEGRFQQEGVFGHPDYTTATGAANRNVMNISSAGSNNWARAAQTDDDATPTGAADDNLMRFVMNGNNNFLGTYQFGSRNNADTELQGNNNGVQVVQKQNDGDGRLFISGDANNVNINSTTGEFEVSIVGSNNFFGLSQDNATGLAANGNHTTANVTGNGNFANIGQHGDNGVILLTQAGDNNIFYGVQNGSNQRIELNQLNNGNYANITQNANNALFSLTQTGGQSVTVTQD